MAGGRGGSVGGVLVLSSVRTLMRVGVRGSSSQGRDAAGVRVMNLDDGETVASVAPVLSAEDEVDPA